MSLYPDTSIRLILKPPNKHKARQAVASQGTPLCGWVVREEGERWCERGSRPFEHPLAGYALYCRAWGTHVCPCPRNTWCPRACEDMREAVARRAAIADRVLPEMPGAPG